ncbi:MAG: type II toxin-antitoxin system VapC family toxin [Candidatus Curtissbacteria bacterium]|nr:type II toxin-antitoxin system VapC family toxin [Candidatus Curtissbacteria bacterium]
MMLLDTHVLVWWISDPEKLPKKIQREIDNCVKHNIQILVSSISIWEIAILFKKGKLGSDMDINAWIEKVESLPFFQFVAVDNTIAAKSVMLVEFSHKDPADRIIVATAREYGAVLVTSDRKLLEYKNVQTLW